jgi:hypothetical protein
MQQSRLLLQVRTRTLNGRLRDTFQRWWPAMTPVSRLTLRGRRCLAQGRACQNGEDQGRANTDHPVHRPLIGTR